MVQAPFGNQPMGFNARNEIPRQQMESAIWEAKADMQRRYPYLFNSTQA